VYLHADQLNTPRLATNGSGTVVGRWDSDAFGVGDADDDPDADTNLVNVRLRFPGQYFDEETGLHYNYYRHYWPHAGRYVQHDPIGLEGGLNPYLYANGNPLRYTDPYGLQITEALRLPGVAEAAAAAARAGAMAPAASGATTAGGLAALGPGAAVAGAGIAGYGIGQVANAGLDSLLTRLTGTTLGVLVYEMCHVDSEEERCRKVLKGCREQCLDTFVNNPSSLPGVGSNTQARQRRCVRECMERNGCFNF
jgi:RHS repeat-associated protein